MELPAPLRRAVDAALEGQPVADLARSAAALSARYRAEVRDGRYHLSDDGAARAYLAARLPATYAAVHAALAMAAKARPDFAPATLLDVGAGPGTALWAATDLWPSCTDALMIEGSAPVRLWGERLSRALASDAASLAITWRAGDILAGERPDDPLHTAPRDLVTMAYVLDEIAPAQRPTLVARLWTLTAGVLAIVEPGTPAGYARIMTARAQLIAAGAHILAPCPHALPCPLVQPDWCHFSRRVARSRIHRLTKGAEVPWEDEKYVFMAASRLPASAALPARVLAPPKTASGRVSLMLCRENGSAGEQGFSRRDGERYRSARKAAWGDALDSFVPSEF